MLLGVLETFLYFINLNSTMNKDIEEIPEEELITQLCNGEESSYIFLMRKYGRRLYAIAKRYTNSDEDAKDCVQQTYIKVFSNIHKFEKRSSLWTWMRRILINISIKTVQSKHRGQEISISDLLPDFDSNNGRTETNWQFKESVDVIISRKESAEIVRNAIYSLPRDYRMVLLLRDIEGYSTEEVAGILEISVSASKTRLHRARAALKNLLEPLMRS